ncbi:hypothetical protein GMDG_03294 [Pseudogymnoascus destructans 20631-21]|uniref:FAD-binding FR-type domain-containing protein n=1 Tax=Pseudogymnoascus destructans (strain ATCC MYA-4855 / 20631-21) TaxID=658429 RepID=L8G7K2_PSED2|nr:hypothetical protein GMDG_03294 [Pseudogymnoascus destructans 20631-21]
MHRCAQLARSTRRVCRGDVGYTHNTTPVAVIFTSRFSTTRAEPSASVPPPPRKSATTTLLLTTLALAAAGATTYQLSSSSSAPRSGLHDRIFTPYTITSKTPISPTSIVFTLSPPPSQTPSSSTSQPDDPFAPLWPTIWSLTFRQPQLQVARSYTPLPPPLSAAPSTPGTLRFLIRREHGGEVSTYLSHLPIGSTIDIRGPVVEYAIPPDVSDVVFLAGGTGIAPALQVIRAVLGDGASGGEGEGEGKHKTVKILWANRQRSECAGAPLPTSWYNCIWGAQPEESKPPSPLVKELRGLEARYPGRVEVRYFIDVEGSFIDRRGILDAVKSVGEKGDGRKLIMVAGPDGFVKHYVGPRVWEGAEEKQGPLGGGGERVRVGGWEVVKL